MTRRRFAFWIGLGLFSLGERLRGNVLDDWAAAILGGTSHPESPAPPMTPEHWVVTNDGSWWWYEREHWVNGHWTSAGTTTPIHLESGQPLLSRQLYLDSSLVPDEVRVDGGKNLLEVLLEASDQQEYGQPDPARRARHGRPPSKWLRSLRADELRIWLKTIDVPEADVSGMTFWTHLTRDHSFDPEKIEGLTIAEQAKLHAAAHYGY